MFYSITLGYSLFAVLLPLSRLSLGVFVFTNRVLKRTKKKKKKEKKKNEKRRSMFSIEKRFSELPACRMQFLDPFCLSSRPINVGVDICESVSSESSDLTYMQRPHISCTLYRARAKFQDNRIVCLPKRHDDRTIINPLRIELIARI